MERGAWQMTVYGVKESDMTEATEHTGYTWPVHHGYWCQFNWW